MNVGTVASEHVATEAFPQAKPKWIQVKLSIGKKCTELRNVVDKYNLYTTCTPGSYPNMGECWGEGTTTSMIFGNIYTRYCGLYEVEMGRPEILGWEGPEKVARSTKPMSISHAVLTSVGRDDLKDTGSVIWAEAIRAVRRMNPNVTMEILIPGFQGVERSPNRILEAIPEIILHNTEAVCRLTREVRIQARYNRSLGVLKYLEENGVNYIKSGIMLGLGEKEEGIIETLHDLKEAKVDTITIGQYLQPSKRHLPAKALIIPRQFARYKEIGMSLGLRRVESGASAHSSYHAQKHLL